MLRFLRSTALAVLTIASVSFFGCSGNKSTNPGLQASDNPGTGSNSIFADVIINGFDLSPSVFSTNYTVVLLDSFNAPITNAAVVFAHSSWGTIILSHDNAFPGTYRASTNGYQPGGYSLSIRRGTDSITGANVIALDLHAITSPAVDDTLNQGNSFNVDWNRGTRADTAEVETRDYGPQQTADDGNFTVSTNPPRNDQRIRVKRFHTLTLAGGRTGSQIRAIIRNTIEPVVVQ